MSHVTCHMSHATCHMSLGTCHMSQVTCHMSHVIPLTNLSSTLCMMSWCFPSPRLTYSHLQGGCCICVSSDVSLWCSNVCTALSCHPPVVALGNLFPVDVEIHRSAWSLNLTSENHISHIIWLNCQFGFAWSAWFNLKDKLNIKYAYHTC